MFGILNILREIFGKGSKKKNIVDSIADSISKPIDNLIKGSTGSGMTDADIEAANLTLKNQQILNEQEWERKIDFYNAFESPAAQVRQYKEAGLNPMLLAGSGAGASASGGVGSAGSAPAQASSGVLGSILGSVLGMITKFKQISTDKVLTSEANDIRRYNAETQRLQAQNYSEYLRSLTIGQNQKNDAFWQAFGVDMANKEADTSAKTAQANYLNEVAGSEVVRRALMESGIRLNDSQTACNEIQKAILKAQEKYSDKYFKAVAEIASSQSTIIGISASVESKLAEEGKEFQYHARVAECADMIFKAGMDLDIWEGDAFKQSVSGKLTNKDWTETVVNILKTLLTGGAILAASNIRAGAAAVPAPVFPGTVPSYLQNNPNGMLDVYL